MQQICLNSTTVVVLPSLDLATQPSTIPSFTCVLDVQRRWLAPKDKDEPDCLQKQYFFKETKCYLFLIVPPCFTQYHFAARLPEVTGAGAALHVCVYESLSLRICKLLHTNMFTCMHGYGNANLNGSLC